MRLTTNIKNRCERNDTEQFRRRSRYKRSTKSTPEFYQLNRNKGRFVVTEKEKKLKLLRSLMAYLLSDK